MEPNNPYSVPAVIDAEILPGETMANGPATGGVWRDGSRLVLHLQASLPPYCVKTGLPVEQTGVQRKFRWHHPAIALTILAGLIVYVVLALILTKYANVFVPLTPAENAKRRKKLIAAWCIGLLSMLGGIAGLVLCFEQQTTPVGLALMLGSFVAFLFALIWGQSLANILKPKRITDTHVWLAGVHRSILERFPELPPG